MWHQPMQMIGRAGYSTMDPGAPIDLAAIHARLSRKQMTRTRLVSLGPVGFRPPASQKSRARAST
jgi:hypothetical protein